MRHPSDRAGSDELDVAAESLTRTHELVAVEPKLFGVRVENRDIIHLPDLWKVDHDEVTQCNRQQDHQTDRRLRLDDPEEQNRSLDVLPDLPHGVPERPLDALEVQLSTDHDDEKRHQTETEDEGEVVEMLHCFFAKKQQRQSEGHGLEGTEGQPDTVEEKAPAEELRGPDLEIFLEPEPVGDAPQDFLAAVEQITTEADEPSGDEQPEDEVHRHSETHEEPDQPVHPGSV